MRKTLFLIASALAVFGVSSIAYAEMVLSQVIVDFTPGKVPREDIEVWNDGSERIYVVAEPAEITFPGTPDETRQPIGLDAGAGLLVSPRRLILEPGERRAIRVATIGQRPEAERIYRVAIKPVAGALSADQTALKVFVGYDALVLVRPTKVVDDLKVERAGHTLTLRNSGNISQELFEGRQCASDGSDCRPLPTKRLYAGASWTLTLPFETEVHYKSAIGPANRERVF